MNSILMEYIRVVAYAPYEIKSSGHMKKRGLMCINRPSVKKGNIYLNAYVYSVGFVICLTVFN